MELLGLVTLVIAVLSLTGTWIQVYQGWVKSQGGRGESPKSQDVVSKDRRFSIAATATVAVLCAFAGAYLVKPRYERLPDDKLIPVVGKQFVNEIVDVDGKHFENCRFVSVTLHLSGRQNFAMVKNSFQGPLRVTFDSEVNSQASTAVVQMLLQAGMITNGRVGFLQPNDSVVILKEEKP